MLKNKGWMNYLQTSYKTVGLNGKHADFNDTWLPVYFVAADHNKEN